MCESVFYAVILSLVIRRVNLENIKETGIRISYSWLAMNIEEMQRGKLAIKIRQVGYVIF